MQSNKLYSYIFYSPLSLKFNLNIEIKYMYHKHTKKMNTRGSVWHDIKILTSGAEEHELNPLTLYDSKYSKFSVNEPQKIIHETVSKNCNDHQ